ncbi:MAG: PQQ-dependent sugar dehydrogenase [Propionibacteriaceae bacterium]
MKVSVVATSLAIPWDVTWVGSTMLVDERSGRLWSQRPAKVRERVKITFPRLWTGSEAGLLGMVADPKAGTNKLFYICVATRTASGKAHDVRVLRYRLSSPTTATAVGKPVVSGLPISTGRHSGCRLRFGADHRLYVSTGDAAQGRNPQNKQSLGGKVLRVNSNGTIPTSNPFYKLGGKARYVWTYGHRNVQGLTLRTGTKQLWSVEQGTYRDDELNVVKRGRNYGYNPVPGYNEKVPMTDTRKYPTAVRAKWSSGRSTIATSGVTTLTGKAWGRWEGAFAVGVLKGQQIRLLRVVHGRVVQSTKLTAVAKGRIRTVQSGPGGALYFTTSNGKNDIVGKVTPRS